MVASDVTGIGGGHITANKMWVPAKDVNEIKNRITVDDAKLGKPFKFKDPSDYGKNTYIKIETTNGNYEVLDMKTFYSTEIENSNDIIKYV